MTESWDDTEAGKMAARLSDIRQLEPTLFEISNILLDGLSRDDAIEKADALAKRLLELHDQGFSLRNFASSIIEASERILDTPSSDDDDNLHHYAYDED